MFLKVRIASSDFVTAVTLGTDFDVSSLDDLVAKVTKVCKPGMLQELVLYGHGASGQFSIGPDTFGGISTPANQTSRMEKLEKLRWFFGGSNGRPRLILCICEAGQNEKNLLAMASSMGNPVYACRGDVHPLLGYAYGWWDGDKLEASPGADAVKVVASIPDPPLILS